MDPQPKKKMSVTALARQLHRDVGFLVLGMTLIYAFSGIVLLYRDTDFLKTPVSVDMTLPAQLAPDALSRELRLRAVAVTGTDAGHIYFRAPPAVPDGTYDTQTGQTRYTEMRLPAGIQPLVRWHKLASSHAMHIVGVVYAALLLFLALSSLAMFKPGTQPFYRGLILAAAGVGVAGLCVWML